MNWNFYFFSQNEDPAVERICYNTMRHEEGDEEVSVKDCILLASGNRKKDLPFIAKVTALWENPDDGMDLFYIFAILYLRLSISHVR